MRPSVPRALLTAAVIAAALIGSAPTARRVLDNHDARDFASFYYAFDAARAGGSPYDTGALGERARRDGTRREVHPFFYPPPFLLALLPAGPFPLLAAYRGWFAVNLLALLAALFAIGGVLAARGAVTPLALAALALTFHPIQDNQLNGQVNLLVLLLIVVALERLARGRDVAAGALIGVAAMIKISPALLVAWLVWRGRWRAVGAAAAAALGLTLLSLPLVGLEHQIEFYTRVLPAFRAGGDYHGLSVSIRYWDNASLPKLWHVLLAEAAGRTTLSPWAARLTVVSTLALLGLAAAALAARRRADPGDRTGFALEAGAVVTLMTLLPTYAWEHHLVFLLLPLAALAAALAERRLGGIWIVSLGAAFLLLAADPKALYAGYAAGLEIGEPLGKLVRAAAMESKLAAMFVVLAGCLIGARLRAPSAGRSRPRRAASA